MIAEDSSETLGRGLAQPRYIHGISDLITRIAEDSPETLGRGLSTAGRIDHPARREEQFTSHGGKNSSHHTAGRTVHITRWEEQFTLHGGKNRASAPLRYTVIVRMDAGYAGRENNTHSPIKSPM